MRWLIAVMDDDDPDLEFVAGLYSYCLKQNGLTDRQGKYASKIFARVSAQFDAGTLAFQRAIGGRKASPAAKVKGGATSL